MFSSTPSLILNPRCSLVLTITLPLVLEEAKYYKTVAPNTTHFDNGPRVVRHPPPSVSLGDDLGLSVSWSCDAVAEGNVAYSWLKNDQVTQFKVIKFPFNQQAGNNFKMVMIFLM